MTNATLTDLAYAPDVLSAVAARYPNADLSDPSTWPLPKHPAKFSVSILAAVAPLLVELLDLESDDSPRPVGIDPFAGTGRIHWLADTTPRLDRPYGRKRLAFGLPIETVGVELMPLWAAYDPRTVFGDSTQMPFDADTFDWGFTSATYENRVNDHFRTSVTDKSIAPRMTYRHQYHQRPDGTYADDPLPETSTARYKGRRYWALHDLVWTELARVLKPGAPFILNMSDSIATKTRKAGKTVATNGCCDRHVELLESKGLVLVERRPVSTPRFRNGSAGSRNQRVDGEELLVFRKANRTSSADPQYEA